MISVGEVEVENKAASVRLYCDFELDGTSDRLWFEVGEDSSKHLAPECGDAFFVILVLLAHLRGQDIEFETPVSTRLYYGVMETLLPALRIAFPRPSEIRVRAETRDFGFDPTATGTALSLGVDSFHALASSFNGPFPVTHLMLFNNGTFGRGEDSSRKLYHATAAKVSIATKELDLPLILVDSNLTRILQSSFVQTHSIRNLSCVLLFPRLFRKYYYASGYTAEQFQLKKLTDAAKYDLLMSKALCTESLEIFIAGLHDKRIDKIDAISQFPPACRHLNVCILSEVNEFLTHLPGDVRNCSRCYKCVKTMTALDALGQLGLYSDVFDLEVYEAERNYNLGWMLYDARYVGDAHAIEIVKKGRETSGFISFSVYIHAVMRGFRNLGKKLKRRLRVFRSGK